MSEPTPAKPGPPAVVFEHVSFAFDDHVVLRDVSFSVGKGGMTLLLGASGAGKSVILKLILGLLCPDAGTISVNGERIDRMPENDLMRVRGDIGMSFQETALFDSLTVAENVGYRLYEETRLPLDEVRARVAEVLGFVGLGEYIDRMPSELSGGQRRRVAIARAMAAKPSLLLLDDPTTGLDPITAATVDDEIVKLRDLERVTSIFVTHQIRDAHYVATHHVERVGGEVRIVEASEDEVKRARFLVLHEGTIFFQGSAAELLADKDAYLREFLFMTLPPW
jgi:phospholipid/cholesterol/gamma-HCH transport system ATP-binding protein